MFQAANTLKHPQAQAAPPRRAPTASKTVFAGIVVRLLKVYTSGFGGQTFLFFLRPAIEGTGDTDDQRAGVSNNFAKIQTKGKIACTGH